MARKRYRRTLALVTYARDGPLESLGSERTAAEVVEHLVDFKKSVLEASLLAIRPGGRLLITTPDKSALSPSAACGRPRTHPSISGGFPRG